MFLEIANLELIPNLEAIYSEGMIFEMPEEDEDNPELSDYADTGYESQYFVKNTGSLLVFILI